MPAVEKRRVGKTVRDALGRGFGVLGMDRQGTLSNARQMRHWAHLRRRETILREIQNNAGSDVQAFTECLEQAVRHEQTASDDASWLRRGQRPMGPLLWAAEMPPPEQEDILVGPGLVIRKGVTLLTGPSKIGKSFIVLELARALAKQDDFLGIYPVTPREDGYRIAYLQGELSDSQLGKRLETLSIPSDRLAIATIRNSDFKLNTQVRFMNREIDTGADRNLVSLASGLQNKAIDVVIFDPLYCFLEGTELDEVAMKSAFSTLEGIAEIANAGVVLVHHNRKSRHGDAISGELSSGHSVLHRAPIAVLTCVNHAMTERDRPRVRMHLELRCAPESPDVEVLRKDDKIFATAWASDARLMVYEFVKDSSSPVTGKDAVSAMKGRLGRSQVYANLKKLVADGLLDHAEPHYWAPGPKHDPD